MCYEHKAEEVWGPCLAGTARSVQMPPGFRMLSAGAEGWAKRQGRTREVSQGKKWLALPGAGARVGTRFPEKAASGLGVENEQCCLETSGMGAQLDRLVFKEAGH